MNSVPDCPLAKTLATQLRTHRDELTRNWLDRISARVTIDPEKIFPTEELLDHVPRLMDGIADYLEDPADEISADIPVIGKAMELGELRLEQGFSAHEILKEYEILGGVLFAYLVRIVDAIDQECTRGELLMCGQRLFRAVSVIQQVTAAQYLRLVDRQVSEKEKRLRQFNRTVTHELKNRIGAVLGASSLLIEPDIAQDGAERREMVQIIHRNAQGMEGVLQDLLSLSRTDESARQRQNVRLPEAAAEALRQLREMAQHRGVELRLSPGMPEVEIDAAAVELCLVNYISNGVKYSDRSRDDRWVEVSAEMETVGEGRREIVVTVTDNGVGVPEGARKELFKPFYRVHVDTDIEGTGLGLSIVRDTIEGLGGRAWAEFPDEGSESVAAFKFSLPANRAKDVAPAARS